MSVIIHWQYGQELFMWLMAVGGAELLVHLTNLGVGSG